MKLSEKTITYALAEAIENNLHDLVELSDEETAKTRLFDEAGYITYSQGFEIKVNGQIFLITVQEK